MTPILRFFLASLSVFALTGKSSGQNLDQLSFGSDDTFEVATWNLEAFPKDGTTTLDSVQKVITALDIDVIGLQEINDTLALRHMVEELPGYGFFVADGFYAGLAYIYKTDAVSIQSIYKIYDSFPFWDIFLRAPVLMELSFQDESLVVINNHLKCCGDGILNVNNEMDEENRRYQAALLLKQYIDSNLPNAKVIVIGDLNDMLTDLPANNVFQEILDDENNYLFADYAIADGPSSNWSYPLWPSHLDHILITNELFGDFANPNSDIQAIKVDNYMSGGLWEYDEIISDHRPVALKIDFDPLTSLANNGSTINTTLFPNPTHGQLVIEFGKQYPTMALKLVALDGRVVQSWSVRDSDRIKLSLNVSAGVYSLVMETNDQIATHRVVKH